MSYFSEKPFGRRRTDRVLTADEHLHLEQIRRDVDQDSTGLIRRYLRLSEKVLELESDDEEHHRTKDSTLTFETPIDRAA